MTRPRDSRQGDLLRGEGRGPGLTLEQAAEIEALLDTLSQGRARLGDREREFVDQIASLYDARGMALALTDRQWDWLVALAGRVEAAR